jgi:hypothetical protein
MHIETAFLHWKVMIYLEISKQVTAEKEECRVLDKGNLWERAEHLGSLYEIG